MADYSMEDEKWQSRQETCIAWFEANPKQAIEDDREMLAKGFFRVGDNHPENRVKYWTAISSLFAGLSNSPLGPGRSSNMSVGQKSQLDLYIEAYEGNRVDAFNTDKHLNATAREHGKSGGEFYRLMTEQQEQVDEDGITVIKTVLVGDTIYATAAGKKERSLLVKSFNAAFKGDDEATYYWPTILHEDGETQILDFSLHQTYEMDEDGEPTDVGLNDGYPNVQYRASEEEE
tara:strand:+ start:95 stop:790 length:696 start_codon:yes stop_codon:yes gene_type:complete